MTVRRLAIAISALLLGIAGPALAGDQPKDAGDLIQKLANRAQNFEKRFDKLDKNKDGAVDRSELDAMTTKMFNRVDKNRDGVIDQDELKAFKEKIAQRKSEDVADRAAKRFEKADKNHDGKVSKDEFLAAVPPWFERADADKDGKLTKDEMVKFASKMGKKAKDKLDDKAGASDAKPTSGADATRPADEKAGEKPAGKDDQADKPDDDDDDMSADKPDDKDDGSKK